MEHQADFAREQEHLEGILRLLRQRLASARRERESQEEGLADTRRDEFQERSEPLLQNFWAAQRFEDLVLLSQEFESIFNEEKEHETLLQTIAGLEKTLRAPYFARIDLKFEEDEEPEKIYIGRSSLWDDQKDNLLIYDWRAPIASVFYRFGTGPAFYQAPAGKIDCELTLKRQFEISHGEMTGYFDADTVIQDSFLRKLLAQNASPQMKAIVETIQKDQDVAIRDEAHDLLMVQGVAGSGKTSIAMHRVAYLMYEGLKNPLRAHHILILSPNRVFEKYISAVLPELGEHRVATTTLEELLEDLLHLPVQSRSERWEALCSPDAENGGALRRALRFKSSPQYFTLLDRFMKEIPRRFLPYQDLAYAGRALVSREEIRSCALEKNASFPLAVRMNRLEKRIWEQVHALRRQRFDELRMMAFRLGHGEEYARGCSIWESGVLFRQLRAMTQLDYRGLYEKLLKNEGLLRELGHDLSLPEDVSCLRLSLPQDGAALSLEDAAAIAYLKLKLDFSAPEADIRQVVVDEAQDYSANDFSLFRLLFPKAKFTVVGDIHQTLDHQADRSAYDAIRQALNRKSAVLMELTKSFRCTRQILNFSLQFLDGVSIDSLNREGAAPQLLRNDQLPDEIAACRAQGYGSIALITKTQQDALRWQERLSPALRVSLMGRDAQIGDVFLVPLALSKGLEFDAVLLLDCDQAHYGAESDKQLLYIACTRALHRLSLFAQDAFSPLIQKGGNPSCTGSTN